jgi:hypothetical protein
MGNLWLKIKIGTKIAIFAILSIAVLVFLFQNVNKEVKIWLWNEYQTTLLKVLFFTALISVVFTILIGTAMRTVRQIKELRARNRSAKLEAEVADMRAKAAMLQTRTTAGHGGQGTTPIGSPLSDAAPPLPDVPPQDLGDRA